MIEDKKESLQIGQKFKNYKEVCSFLGEPTKGGKSKQLQIEDWKRYFVWEKCGNAYLVKQLIDTPIDKEDKRSNGSHTIYKHDIEIIIIYFLLMCEKKNLNINSLYVTWGTLADALYMTNENFTNWKTWYNVQYEQEDVVGPLLLLEKDVKRYRIAVTSRLRGYIRTALNSLAKNKYIVWHDEIVYRDRDGIDHVATDEEKTDFFEIWHETIQCFKILRKPNVDTGFGEQIREKAEEVQCTRFADIIITGQEEAFYDKLNNKCFTELGWYRHTSYCKISTTHKLLEYALEEKQAAAAHSGYVLNNNICNGIKKLSQLSFLDESSVDFLTKGLMHIDIEDNDIDFVQKQAEKLLCRNAAMKENRILNWE